MKVKGICSRCERRRSRDPRKLTPLEKAVVVILAVYAFGTILPDFGRLIPPEVLRDWGWCRSILGHSCYPLGTLGFQADNDGKITQVDNSGPAWKEGIREGDVIDLSSPKTERRAVNQFVFVAIGQQHSLQLLLGRKSAHDVPLTLNPVPEQLSGAEWWGLFIAQLAACVFILFSLWLVLRRPGSQTWGLFLYSIWFNSGQYFFWYANLPDAGLRVFDYIQAFLEALGLVGILLFALYFPQESVDGRRNVAWRLLVIPFVLLWVVRLWTFRNFTHGQPTQNAYLVWYFLTLVVFIVMGSLLSYSYMTQIENRPQIRMVALGAMVALFSWLIADTYETIGFPPWNWLRDYVDFLYGASFMLPLAVFFAIRRFRVIDVRFPISRATVVIFVSVVLIAVLHPTVHRLLDEKYAWVKPMWLPLGFLLVLFFAFLESRLRRWVQMAFFPRWYKVESQLRENAEELAHPEDIHLNEVNCAVLDDPVEAIPLKCGALYKRTDAGVFEHERSFGLDIDCQRCKRAVHSELVPLSANNPVFKRLVTKHESQGRPQEHSRRRDRLPLDWSAPNCSAGFTEPAHAVPIVRWHEHKRVLTRVVFFGPHVMDQDLDPDEINVLDELGRAAGTAYIAARSAGKG